MVLKKNKKNDNIQFIDASKEFVKVTNNNKLSEDNITNIYNYFINKKDVEHVSKLVNYENIKENDYYLSVNTYVEKEDTKEVVDIKALNKQIEEIVSKENELRKQIDMIIKEIEWKDFNILKK